MAQDSYDFEGKTIDDAVTEGLNHLGLALDQVDIEVIHKGSRGIFGIGSEPARIRITRRVADEQQAPPEDDRNGKAAVDNVTEAEFETESESEPILNTVEASTGTDSHAASDTVASTEGDGPTNESSDIDSPLATPEADESNSSQMVEDEVTVEVTEETDDAPVDDAKTDDEVLTEMAIELLEKMTHLMGFDTQVIASWKDPEPGESTGCLHLDIEGENLGPLIGRRGETLASIQYLLRLMVNQKLRSWKNIVVDVEHYKERKAQQLTQLALRMAEQVIDTNRAMSLEPMPSNERRVVHLALRNHPDVITESSGEGDRRKVHIVPKEQRS